MRRVVAAAFIVFTLPTPDAGKTLDVYFIDVEGGQSTLIVTPAGESLLIDAGFPGRSGRDPDRILEAAHDAGVDRIDYLLITHFHPDHVGGVPELASRVPIGTFIDYGAPLGTDRSATRLFSAYEPVRRNGRHLQPHPGDRLPLKGVDIDIVSADGMVLSKPLEKGGRTSAACRNVEDQPDDGTENFRSIGLRVKFGRFRFVDLGDLSGNTLVSLFCPRNLVGEASVYLVAHHGDYDSNVPAALDGLRPRVAVLNNGPTKGGAPEAFQTLHAHPAIEDLWQLHASRRADAENSADTVIANVDDGATGYWIKLTASDDGAFSMINGRTGFTNMYRPVGKTRTTR